MPRGINHQELRAQFRLAVCRLMNQLRTFSRYILKVDELQSVGVYVSEFDPFDLNEAIIFQPFPEQELLEYHIDEVLLQDEWVLKRLELPDWTPLESSNGVISRREEELDAKKSSERIFEHLEAMYSCLSKTYEPNNPLSMARNWTDIPIPHPEYTWPPELDINSWPREPGLLNHGPTAEHVGWCCQQAAEWKEHVRRGEPRIQPHVRLVVVHGATGTPNGVLLGELGTIAQVIYNRLNQPRFENDSYFPVLVISLFGPRHGRILQAVYRRSGHMELRITQIYDFTKTDDAPFDLFLRYLASNPRRDEY
ncbi:hypothetical protein PMG11_08529 [Penicillium brasilianum]|uniref:Uncharacterized protein n=1 Tax=Penicillium brasilianum TaxID=104259 RepID=A0A0F7TVP5_PENBI|nr:hypothetical protein PMG11_08529 [Penicillium brasilianum]